MNWGALPKRRRSPASATIVTRGQEADAADRLKGANHLPLAGRLGTSAQGRLEPLDAFAGRAHLRQIVAEHHPIGELVELDPIQPLLMALRPVAHTRRRLDALAQQKLAQAVFG